MDAWLSMWMLQPALHARVQKVWSTARRALSRAGGHRWRRVRGPIGAIQATLLDLGWDTVEAKRWHRPTAAGYDERTLPTAGDERFASFTEYQSVLDDVVADLRSHCGGMRRATRRAPACKEEQNSSPSLER